MLVLLLILCLCLVTSEDATKESAGKVAMGEDAEVSLVVFPPLKYERLHSYFQEFNHA